MDRAGREKLTGCQEKSIKIWMMIEINRIVVKRKHLVRVSGR
jgi:hypothetical protein